MEKNKQIAATVSFLIALFTLVVHAQSKVHSGIVRKYSRWIVVDRTTAPRDYGYVLGCRKC